MLPRASIEEFLYEEEQHASAKPEQIVGVDDSVIYHLALALPPSFARARERDELFIEQVMLVLLAHVQDRFASAQIPVCIGEGLMLWQLRRTKELTAGHLTEGVSVARLAEECGLSRNYFTKAFKCSAGISPHEWLMRMCVDRAKGLMLGNDEPLPQIGTAYSFSDRPHFSRVFLRLAGASPSTWRRIKRQRTDAALWTATVRDGRHGSHRILGQNALALTAATDRPLRSGAGNRR